MFRRIPTILVLCFLSAGCVHAHLLQPMPPAECDVLQDLIAELDNPARAKGQNGSDYSPSGFPAFPKLNYVAGYQPNKADLQSCIALIASIEHRTTGSVSYAREQFRDGAKVDFSRVTIQPNETTAHVHYSVSYGPLAAEGWYLTLTKQPDGKWKLTAWKLEMES